MDREAELGAVRRAYAKQVLAIAGVDDPAVEDAFATVRREAFLGPGPWLIERWGQTLGYIPTSDADPVHLYQDNLVGVVPERRLNNGQPSYHADLIHQAAPRAGEHIVHIGAGVGYYTAILAHLVGSSGRVTGIEFDHELSSRATAHSSLSTSPMLSTSMPAQRYLWRRGSIASPTADA